MTAAEALVLALRDPGVATRFDAATWTAVLTAARAEQLIGSLAYRLAGLDLPMAAAAAILADARDVADHGRTQALWEVEMARRALAPLGCPVILLKGSAYVAAGLASGQGRSIGDLDILVPRASLDAAERALLGAGWEWVKPDPYDDVYYRRWMHELPPLIHRDRDRMIDVHHTILPLTARPKPDAGRLLAEAERLENGLFVLSPADMIVHAAAHLIADGDLAGGLRNLWDIDRLVREFTERDRDFCQSTLAHAENHQLRGPTAQALRLGGWLFGTPLPGNVADLRERSSDRLFRHRVHARDGWGRATRPVTRAAFYLRSHALRMPPAMLARHLWIKWRRPAAAACSTPAAG